MIDIAEKLKNVPKGTKLYSPMFGECVFCSINSFKDILVEYKEGINCTFNLYGQFNSNGECILFPSKENKDWNNFYFKVETFYNFKPFDKVIVRELITSAWKTDFFSHYNEDSAFPYVCVSGEYKECFSFNEKTIKLLGTK